MAVEPSQIKETANWMASHWKAGLAFIYSLIVIFDFIIVPVWIGLHRLDLLVLLDAVKDMSPEAQASTLALAYRQHVPYTLQGAGLIHIAFGALLTGSAITKDYFTSK